MKSDSPFSKLPSLSDLLSHPTVAKVVTRVNQSTIAHRATGFLEELQANLRQRIGEGGIPSLGQLAERLAKRLLGPNLVTDPAVNATGVVLGDTWPALPLAEPAVDGLVQFATEYQSNPSQLAERSAELVEALTGAEAAWVAHTFAAAEKIARSVGGNIESSRLAGILNPADYGLEPVTTLAERIRSGVDLLVIEGAGLLGGPPCGIVLGKLDKVAECRRHAPQDQLSACQLTLAALAATLQVYQLDDHAIHQIPVWQLLTAPLENLEQRAIRLATLLAESSRVSSARAVKCESTWCQTPEANLCAPSWAISLKPASGTAEQLCETLDAATPRVVARIAEEEVLLDLRSVFPRWDQHLVSALE